MKTSDFDGGKESRTRLPSSLPDQNRHFLPLDQRRQYILVLSLGCSTDFGSVWNSLGPGERTTGSNMLLDEPKNRLTPTHSKNAKKDLIQYLHPSIARPIVIPGNLALSLAARRVNSSAWLAILLRSQCRLFHSYFIQKLQIARSILGLGFIGLNLGMG